MKRILLIDGNYLGMRVLGQLNMADQVNYLESSAEQQSFTNTLNSSLINLYQTFNNPVVGNLVDQIIFCRDGYSWRKQVPPHRPYYIKETDPRPIGYKENRVETKEKSAVNYDNFNMLYNQFVESIKDKVIVFDPACLEGDDSLMLIANKFNGNPNYELIVFCTDGDLVQIVKPNCMLMRNIRSKECPNGEFVISLNKYGEVFENQQDKRLAFLGNTVDLTYYKKLFGVRIGDMYGNAKVERKINQGIDIATPYKTALIKTICGDKKDNIFSILSWESSTGNINYKITEKQRRRSAIFKNFGDYSD